MNKIQNLYSKVLHKIIGGILIEIKINGDYSCRRVSEFTYLIIKEAVVRGTELENED